MVGHPVNTSGGQPNSAFGEVSERTGPPFGVRVGRIGSVSLGRRVAEGPVARERPQRRGPRAGGAGLSGWVFGVTSWAAVLLSIEPVVASGEWSSPVDQDHPGDLWPGS